MSEPNDEATPEVSPADAPDQVPGQDPIVTLTVTYQSGRVGLTGPLDDQILCYGLLQIAMDQVRAYKDRQRREMVAGMGRTPSGLVVPGLGGQHGGKFPGRR